MCERFAQSRCLAVRRPGVKPATQIQHPSYNATEPHSVLVIFVGFLLKKCYMPRCL